MYYYKYNFVSPETLYARVKEQLKSYFDTGAVDDLLFPIWTKDCLDKLGKSSLKILPAILYLDDFQAKLPPDFHSVREAWLCTDILPQTVRLPGSYYSQVTTRLPNPEDNESCQPCDMCNPLAISIVYKTTTEETFTRSVKHLLKPGNISAREHCAPNCLNCSTESHIRPYITNADEFDIRGNHFITNFRHGDVYLVYYSNQKDPSGFDLVPDNFRIQDYIRKYLTARVFETLWNQITDETSKQIAEKYEVAEKRSDEAFIMADIEVKKQTVYDKARAIKRDANRNNKYIIR